jgi:glycosyltransferase involved in cell wall biosynthesis
MSEKKLRVLMELRPALEGYAGIPQETRLLFRGLCDNQNIELEGLLVAASRKLARGTQRTWSDRGLSPARKMHRYSRVAVSLTEKPVGTPVDAVRDFLSRHFQTATLSLVNLLGIARITLTRLEARYFEDFIWRTLFSKSLPASDFRLVTAKNHRVCSVSWFTQQKAGLVSLISSRNPRYPRLDTSDFDIMVSQTPYPGRVAPSTTLVVRYHDAIPIFMPHTIPRKSTHQAHHFYSLLANVRAGAHFACVSDASRESLHRLFPETAERSITIHDMVSANYFPEDSPAERVPLIIRNRLDSESKLAGPTFLSLRESAIFYRRALFEAPLRYLLVVATIEPRKNHTRLLAAWETLRARKHPDLKLVVVGSLGWDCEAIMRGFRAAIDQGDAFFLNNVPAADLRVLYRHALVTVCPSLAEGFDYSGVEAMRSGGVVAASDIPVHREIYADAAEYFDPYSTSSLAATLDTLLAPGATARHGELRELGRTVSVRYLPSQILPQWHAFFERLSALRTRV